MHIERQDEGGYAFYRAVGERYEDERKAQADIDTFNRGRPAPHWEPSFVQCNGHPRITMSHKTVSSECLICKLAEENKALQKRIADAAQMLVEGKAVQAHKMLTGEKL